MSDDSDTEDVVHRLVTDAQADQLVAGQADVDADSVLEAIAGLLGVLREPARPEELAGTDELLARIAETVRHSAPSARITPWRKAVLTRLTAGKIAAIATATILSTGVAAAATGNLPDPVQSGVSTTFARVGIDVPNPRQRPSSAHAAVPTTKLDSSSTTTVGPTTTAAAALVDTTAVADTTTIPPSTASVPDDGEHGPVGPDATGPAAHGLCTAYLAGGDHGHRLDSTAMTNLTEAATEAGTTVEDYCAAVFASDGHGKSDGKSDDTPDDDDAPATTVPSDEHPSATAPGHSGDDESDGQGGGPSGSNGPGVHGQSVGQGQSNGHGSGRDDGAGDDGADVPTSDG